MAKDIMNKKMKTTRSAILLVFMTSVLLSAAQNAPLKKSYSRLQGNIGKDLRTDMHMIRIGDTLFGEFFCHGYTKSPDMYFQEGVVISFAGKAEPQGTFKLWDPNNDRSFTFRGRFIKDGVNGIFEPAPGKGQITFSFKEQYPDGSLQFSVYFQQGRQPLVRKPGSPSAHTALSLILPSDPAGDPATDTVRKAMLHTFTNHDVRNNNPDLVLDGIRQVFFQDYITTNESFYKQNMGQSFAWELLRHMHIVLNGQNLLSYYVEEYSYTGGAHGLQTRMYEVLNLTNGKKVGLKDIFKEGFEEKLTSILTRKAQEQMQNEPGKSLRDAGFFVDEVTPNDNFYITPGGIGFFYNHYEIAPYSFGPEDYFISFEELGQLTDKSGILKELFR